MRASSRWLTVPASPPHCDRVTGPGQHSRREARRSMRGARNDSSWVGLFPAQQRARYWARITRECRLGLRRDCPSHPYLHRHSKLFRSIPRPVIRLPMPGRGCGTRGAGWCSETDPLVLLLPASGLDPAAAVKTSRASRSAPQLGCRSTGSLVRCARWISLPSCMPSPLSFARSRRSAHSAVTTDVELGCPPISADPLRLR